MKSQALFDAMAAAVKTKGPELVKMGGAATCLQVDILCSTPAIPLQFPGNFNAKKKNEHWHPCEVPKRTNPNQMISHAS